VVRKLGRCPFRVSRNKPWTSPSRVASSSQKLARPGLPETSQPRPRSQRVISDAVSGAARWPLPLCCRRFDESKQNGGRASSPETLTGSRGPSAPSRPKTGRRVWTPLMGFIKDRPSTDISLEYPPPVCSEELTFGPKLPRSEHVPPLPFRTTPTVFATRHLAGLLHPAAGHGVRHVSAGTDIDPRAPARYRHSRWRTPFEAFPSAAAPPSSHRRSGFTESVCPLAVTGARSGHSRCRGCSKRCTDSTSGLCSTAESVASRRRCHRQGARCSHGLSSNKEPYLRRLMFSVLGPEGPGASNSRDLPHAPPRRTLRSAGSV